MQKILFFVEHDIGEAGADVITFIIKLCQEYLCLLVGREGFVGGHGGSGNDGIIR